MAKSVLKSFVALAVLILASCGEDILVPIPQDAGAPSPTTPTAQPRLPVEVPAPPALLLGSCQPVDSTVECYSSAPHTEGVGSCSAGTRRCQATDSGILEWSACEGEVGPTLETCDGVDNDCDGEMDEGLGTVSCGVGLCAQTMAACMGGEPQFCNPFTGSTIEVCDGADNDCDGVVDNNQGVLSCGMGQCAQTMAACVDGAPQSCEPFAGATGEVCDGIDNDCDGVVDEGLGTLSCGAGQCSHSVTACVAGIAQVCDPFANAGVEICDGIDNDCDGEVDEGLGTVSCGLGLCAQTKAVCVGGEPQFCNPFAGATSEVCDGADNDCNGVVDNSQVTLVCGTGQCAKTVASCVDGSVQTCDPFAGATTELCDGIDNDCDGVVDEDQPSVACGVGQCAKTVATCSHGTTQTCDPLAGATAEICGDGIDNDCDGVTSVCVESFLVGASINERPVDVIWAIDSSSSMSQEMATVEANINAFADALDAAASSNALHLLSDRGTGSFEICVEPPLAAASCGDNAPHFFHYDTNGNSNGDEMVHSSNALGRIMQQHASWGPRLQAGAHIAFVVTTDDDGDDPNWKAPNDDSESDDCTETSFIVNSTATNRCRWRDASSNKTYTSLANDFGALYGFKTFMANKFPNAQPGVDWTFYPIVGATGDNGLPQSLQFSCASAVETGDEYVKLAQFTGTEGAMTPICLADWDLAGLATAIAENVPESTFTLLGNPLCDNINPATLFVRVNGVLLAQNQWQFTPATCALQITSGVPQIGDVVQFDYDNY